jgi:hypothetical protein
MGIGMRPNPSKDEEEDEKIQWENEDIPQGVTSDFYSCFSVAYTGRFPQSMY